MTTPEPLGDITVHDAVVEPIPPPVPRTADSERRSLDGGDDENGRAKVLLPVASIRSAPGCLIGVP